MDPFTMAELLLGDMTLTPGQLAQLRALNTKYFTALAALQEHAGGEDSGARPADSAPPRTESAPLTELHARIASDIREMLSAEQRAVLDRNLPRLAERELERPIIAARDESTPPPPSPAPLPPPDSAEPRRP